MRQSVVLIGVCALVLVGAWLASRALSEPEPIPLLPGQPATPPPAPAPVAIAEPIALPSSAPVAPPRLKVDPRALIDGARSGQLEPVAKDQAAVALREPADEEPNPFVGESRELDYADRLMWEQDGGVDRLRSARDVYARCLEAVPESQRCKDGLAAADLRLHPPKAVVRPEPIPTLNSPDPLNPQLKVPRLRP